MHEKSKAWITAPKSRPTCEIKRAFEKLMSLPPDGRLACGFHCLGGPFKLFHPTDVFGPDGKLSGRMTRDKKGCPNVHG